MYIWITFITYITFHIQLYIYIHITFDPQQVERLDLSIGRFVRVADMHYARASPALAGMTTARQHTWRMLTHADVCWRAGRQGALEWRMLTYPHVSSRILTYPHVWRSPALADTRVLCKRILHWQSMSRCVSIRQHTLAYDMLAHVSIRQSMFCLDMYLNRRNIAGLSVGRLSVCMRRQAKPVKCTVQSVI